VFGSVGIGIRISIGVRVRVRVGKFLPISLKNIFFHGKKLSWQKYFLPGGNNQFLPCGKICF
jgi:pantoate kinase